MLNWKTATAGAERSHSVVQLHTVSPSHPKLHVLDGLRWIINLRPSEYRLHVDNLRLAFDIYCFTFHPFCLHLYLWKLFRLTSRSTEEIEFSFHKNIVAFCFYANKLVDFRDKHSQYGASQTYRLASQREHCKSFKKVQSRY